MNILKAIKKFFGKVFGFGTAKSSSRDFSFGKDPIPGRDITTDTRFDDIDQADTTVGDIVALAPSGVTAILPSEFEGKTSGSYEEGELVIYDNAIYKRNSEDSADTSWVAEHWTAATDADLAARIKNLKSNGFATDEFASELLGKQVANIKANSSAFAPEYDATSEYAVGEFVWYNGIIYQCDAANSQADPHEPTGGDSDAFWHVEKLDDFFTKSNSLLTGTIDDRLPIPISEKSEGFTTESYKRFVVTVSGDMTVTIHTPTGYDAEIFECRFNGISLSADASITFAGATVTTMDANCGTVTAGKVALMSAFWNGSTWDVNWKVEG